MLPKRSGLNLVPVCLILAGCAAAPVAQIRLPEPPLPACLVEEPPRGGEAVGRYEFAPVWLAPLVASIAQGRGTQATQEALGCASETAKALREAVTVIRMNNQP